MQKVGDNEDLDHLSAIGVDDDEEVEQKSKHSSVNQKHKKQHSAVPSHRLMNKLLHDQFAYDRKKTLFLSVNTVTMTLSIFNLYSSINIEGQDSILLQSELATLSLGQGKPYSLYYLIFCLIVVHLIKIFSCMIGFFAVQQKSERLITYYMILSSLSLILRGIVTLLLIISYETIEKVLTDIFEEGEDVASIMTLQYVVILIVFVVIEILLSLMSLVQGSQSKEEYARYKKYHDKLLRKQLACYEIALKTYF